MWSALKTPATIIQSILGNETVWVRSKGARISIWSGAMLTSFKGLNLSRDKADDINVGGNILYGCIGFFLFQEVS